MVGLGAFTGATALWKPERTIFDMGRAAVLLRQNPNYYAFDVAIPTYGGYVLSLWDADMMLSATKGEAILEHWSVKTGAHKIWQPVVDGRADFILPTGEGLRLRVY